MADPAPADLEPERRPYHERLVAGFVAHDHVEEAARVAGVSVRTAHRWKAVHSWWTEVEEMRREIQRAALERVAAAEVAALARRATPPQRAPRRSLLVQPRAGAR